LYLVLLFARMLSLFDLLENWRGIKNFCILWQILPFIKNVPFPYTTLFVVHVFSKIDASQFPISQFCNFKLYVSLHSDYLKRLSNVTIESLPIG